MALGNLGIKKKDMEPSLSIAVPYDHDAERKKEGDKIHYPSFNLTNKHIEAAGLKNVQPDDIIQCTMTMRVSSVSKKSKNAPSYNDDRVELDVQNIDDVTMLDPKEDEDDPGWEDETQSDEPKSKVDKFLGFDSSKAGKSAPISPKNAGIRR